jgi:hypothetical protein
MIHHHFYENQIRSYIRQFMGIFSGLQVQTGRSDCDPEMISVPCIMGFRDRVVSALMAGNTQNRMVSLPVMSVYMSNLEMAPDRRKVPSLIDQRVTMPVGGVFPDDLTTLKRAMPVPYNMEVELSIMASNLDQMYQILEQILVLFNPDLQIQKSDSPLDWTMISSVELVGISNEENYPIAATNRTIIWSLTFKLPIFISIPMGVRDDLVRKISIDIANGTTRTMEVDSEGNIVPFGSDSLGKVTVTQEDFLNKNGPKNPKS